MPLSGCESGPDAPDHAVRSGRASDPHTNPACYGTPVGARGEPSAIGAELADLGLHPPHAGSRRFSWWSCWYARQVLPSTPGAAELLGAVERQHQPVHADIAQQSGELRAPLSCCHLPQRAQRAQKVRSAWFMERECPPRSLTGVSCLVRKSCGDTPNVVGD